MTPFQTFTALAAPLAGSDIDTDQIFPARYMSRPRFQGYADALFHDHRFDSAGQERPEFILNRPPWRMAQILIAGRNFACGSAREHSVHALIDGGFRVIMAPSFGDIFASSAMENGLLVIALPQETVDALVVRAEEGQGLQLTIDLEAQLITDAEGLRIAFQIPARQRQMLLSGADALATLLDSLPQIKNFEAGHEAWQPVSGQIDAG
jgi:3-isopropylmalate/(R)-2-methylmalate dehydratase small subunit